MTKNPALRNCFPISSTNGRNGICPENANAPFLASYNCPPGSGRYRDEDFPACETTPLIPKDADGGRQSSKPAPEIRRRWYQPPPDLPLSSQDSASTHIQTRFPDYSTDAETLQQMIYEHASYPPTYYLELKGTHTETTYHRRNVMSLVQHTGTQRPVHRVSSWSANNGRKSQKTITDFFIRINITHLLSPGPGVGGELKLLADNEKGYRGGVIPRFTPSVCSPEIENQHAELKAWCDRYVTNPSGIKSFTLERIVSNHDTKKLDSLLRSLVASTNYRGNVSVDFPITHQSVTVYSPGIINRCRMATWIRWFFYITFLWLCSWPLLFFATARYEVVKVVYPYADTGLENGNRRAERRPMVMSEQAWFQLWENSIRRGVLGRMDCSHLDMDDGYRLATEAMIARGQRPVVANRVQNRYHGGVGGVFEVSTHPAGQWLEREGWGYDC